MFRYVSAHRLRLPVKAGGFTLFELILVIVLVALFAGGFQRRFVDYQEIAEKTAMEQTAGTIQSALNIQMAAMISRGRVADIPKLAAINPFKLLNERQKNYAGEYYDAREVVPGNWYYDLKNKEAVYLVSRGAHFKSDRQGEKRVRFKVTVVYNDPLPGETSPIQKELGGIVFKEVDPYVWDFK
jgi:type II secretory pathway pseudopilin PulG